MAQSSIPITKRFVEGDLVEVRQNEKGLRGAWFAAVIVGVLPGKRIVEYDELLAQEGTTTKLRETLSVSLLFDGQRRTLKLAARAAKPFIRPRPTRLQCPTPFFWTKGTWIDCWYEDAWWEGILDEDVTTAEDTGNHWVLTPKTEVAVRFPGEHEVMNMQVKSMRLTQDFHEDGTWSQRQKIAIQLRER